MLKGLGELGNIMKLQKEMKGIQKRIASSTMDGESKDKFVSVTINGEYRLLRVAIDPEAASQSGVEKLEESIILAVNDAVNKMKDYSAAEMGKLTEGLNIPGLGNFFK